MELINKIKPNADQKIRLIIKRIMDTIVSGVILLLIWPLLLAISLFILVFEGMPIFYRGVRVGKEGKIFNIYKFRTMVINAEKMGGPTTGTGDPRVTSIGLFLRKTKLDEIPQFINVFIGDMSLVGPRPEVKEYVDRYTSEEKKILFMRPGLTDYASIEFVNLDDLVGKDDPDEYFKKYVLPIKNKLRVKYVDEWSLINDFIILWKTVVRVIKRWCEK